jgi:hypothetical protein
MWFLKTFNSTPVDNAILEWPWGFSIFDCRMAELPIADSGQLAPIANRQSLLASCDRGHLLTPAAYSCPG